jgi:hypothetical protein
MHEMRGSNSLAIANVAIAINHRLLGLHKLAFLDL